MLYIIAYDKYFCDEFGFETLEDIEKFKKENPKLTFGKIRKTPLIIQKE